MTYCRALFYSSAYKNGNAGYNVGNKKKLYETYSHCLVISLFCILQQSDLENAVLPLFLCGDYNHSQFSVIMLFTICSLFH